MSNIAGLKHDEATSTPKNQSSTARGERGILTVPGFMGFGVHTGLKSKRADVGLIASDRPCTTAAVFTRNAFAAAPVQVSREHLAKGDVRAIVVNSGNANACTGTQGLADARDMTMRTAASLGLDPHQVLVCSTGIIGRPLDMQKVHKGIDQAATGLETGTGQEIMEAIMTTDAFDKQAHTSFEVDGRTYHVGGIAKGAGMIHPNMATMLGFLTTDAPVPQSELQALLAGVVDETFNMITVDGDESTNDTVTLMANGAAGGDPLDRNAAGWSQLRNAVFTVCRDLAKMIPADGEGATRLMEVRVTGAENLTIARDAAREITASSLVKSAVHGGDPNWGRVVAALGARGAPVQPEKVTVRFGTADETVAVLVDGEPQGGDVLQRAAQNMQGKEVHIEVTVGTGSAEATAWGCDLTEAYVRFNSAYST